MSNKIINLVILMLASEHLLATEEFTPAPQHLNVFIKNPKQAPYLLKIETDAPLLTPTQQRDYISFIALRLGVPDTPPKLLIPALMPIPWLPAPNKTGQTQNSSNGIIKTHWKNNVLFITIQPNQLDYDTLLQNALTALEQANNGRLPVINGRDFKTALEERDGKALPIYKRALATQKATQPQQ